MSLLVPCMYNFVRMVCGYHFLCHVLLWLGSFLAISSCTTCHFCLGHLWLSVPLDGVIRCLSFPYPADMLYLAGLISYQFPDSPTERWTTLHWTTKRQTVERRTTECQNTQHRTIERWTMERQKTTWKSTYRRTTEIRMILNSENKTTYRGGLFQKVTKNAPASFLP